MSRDVVHFLNMYMKRVVVTGIGIYSCLGKNLEEVSKSLYEGKSGIGIDPMRIEYGYRSPLTGIVERPQLKGILDRRARVCLPEQGEYAFVATAEAFKNAGVDAEYLEKNEVGIFYGNDSSAKAVIDAHTVAPFQVKKSQLVMLSEVEYSCSMVRCSVTMLSQPLGIGKNCS